MPEGESTGGRQRKSKRSKGREVGRERKSERSKGRERKRELTRGKNGIDEMPGLKQTGSQ